MSKRRTPGPTRTLFDLNYKGHGGGFGEHPYYDALMSRANDPDEKRFGGFETSIFGHVVEHKIKLA